VSFDLVEHDRLASPRAQYFPEIVTRGGTVELPARGLYDVTLSAERVGAGAPEGIGITGIVLDPVASAAGRGGAIRKR
jgi:hypothetical protein